jgi:hypothetical protein
MRAALFAIGSVLLFACGETEECKQLKEIEKQNKDILVNARSRARSLERVEKHAQEIEASAKKLLAELGLDQPESKLQTALEERAHKIPGATIEKGARPPEEEGLGKGPPGTSETYWSVHFKEKDATRALKAFDELSEGPPLFRLGSIRHDPKDMWSVEIVRAVAEQIPIHPKAAELPRPKDLSTIPSELGACGAGKLRAEIAKQSAEIESFRAQAEQMSVAIQSGTSYDGLRARTELLRDSEAENRRLARILEDAVVKEHLSIRSLGVNGVLVALEVQGGKKELVKIEKVLVAQKVADIMKLPQSQPMNAVRVMLPNQIGETRRADRTRQGNANAAPKAPPKKSAP